MREWLAMLQPLARRPAFAAGAILFLAAACLAALLPGGFMPGYLLAYLACLEVVLGALALLLIHALTGGEWGRRLDAPLRAALATLPGFALLALPLAFSLEAIFPWAGPGRAALDLSAHQRLWLQPALEILRGAGYFAAWLAIAAGLLPRRRPRMAPLRAGLCLVAFALLTSLFAVDWFMALTPAGSTTMIGFLLLSEQLVAALALAALWSGLHAAPPDRDPGGRAARIDIGNLLLSAVMFHGYCLYMDYLIVWEGNLPPEIAWYLQRNAAAGASLPWAVSLLYIALPVVLLLFRGVKASGPALAAVAGLVLLGHLLLVYWYLAPYLGAREAGGVGLWQGLLALGLAGLWAAAFHALARRLAGRGEEAQPC